MSYTRRFHFTIYHGSDETTKAMVRQWTRCFDSIEEMSHGLSFGLYATTDIDIGDDMALSLLITGRDLFLGVKNTKTKQLFQEAEFEQIKYLSSNAISCIRKDIAAMIKNDRLTKQDKRNVAFWGRQIANIRIYEKQRGLDPETEIKLIRIENNIKILNNKYFILDNKDSHNAIKDKARQMFGSKKSSSAPDKDIYNPQLKIK